MKENLKKMVLTEAELTDKITSRAKITFGALVDMMLELGIDATEDTIDELSDKLGVKPTSLEKYIELSKSKKFIDKDGSVNPKYAKEAAKGKVKASGKISQALDNRIKKFKAPKVSKNNIFSNQVFKMLSLMQGQAATAGVKNSLMLTGDPGVGKTSFIRNFSKLLGLPLIPIEAPHITEEHIINIPFMIINGNKVKKDNAIIETSGKQTLNDDAASFDIVQSESNLVTKLKAMKNLKLKGKQHLTAIAQDKNLREVYYNNRRLIKEIRESYHCILFLDEYYRNDNMKIRNILRNILNGRIGNDKIPKGTFIVYASNMDDDGVEDIPMNNDFAEMEFDAPDKEQWFDWFLNTYVENEDKTDYPGVKMDPTVFNKFYDTLKQSELSFEDKSSEVRSSPRRWEQILLYVNASLPVANVKEAKLLMSNLRLNFRNYAEESMSNLYPKIEKMVVELIDETSGIQFDGQPTSEVEWKNSLQQQLEVKIKLDGEGNRDPDKEVRQYVPVVSGAPGIGKTAHMRTVADNMNLYFIDVDTSTLTRESTTGIPTADQATDMDGNLEVDEKGKPVMTTKFSKPELLDLIEKKMQEEIDEDSIFPEAERKKGQGKYRFLLLFDELTRADAQVFNAIRKLLLEKSFNEEYDLPEDILLVGALNPTDLGAEELTKHVRDVLDIIPARSSWAKTETYLLSEDRPNGIADYMGFDMNTSTVGALKLLLSQYQSQAGDEDHFNRPIIKEERMFNLVDGGNIIYISPREITDIVTMTNTNIVNRLTKAGLSSFKSVDDDAEEEKRATIKNTGSDDFMSMMMAEEDTDEDFDKSLERDNKMGIFNPSNRYSEEDYDIFIQAMLVEFREAWASKLSFICKKMDISAGNVLSITTGFIMKNDRVYDQYEAIKTLVVDDVKGIDEMFNAYYEDPDALYDSPHFDNYLSVNFAAPQKFTQEITEFISDKMSEIEQESNPQKITYDNEKGEPVEYTTTDKMKTELYVNYLKYVRVILKVLTKKSQYAGKVKEAERTGQYLGNLYMSLQMIGRDFMNKQKLIKFVNPGTKNVELFNEVTKVAGEIRGILTEFGIDVIKINKKAK